jgi:hypothetical protein
MKTLILVEVETLRAEQGEYVRAESERLLVQLLREKGYVVNVRAAALGAGSIAGELAMEVLRLRLMLEKRA